MLPQLQSKLAKRLTLSHHYGIVIPSTVNVDKSADHKLIESVCDTVESRLSSWFGGFTAYHNCDGGWPTVAKVVKEPVIVYIANCDKNAMLAHFDDVEALATSICRTMSQEAVSLIVDGELVLITDDETVTIDALETAIA